jgi:hypothetical protein
VTVNEMVQELARRIRLWAPNEKERHDTIGLLTSLQGEFILLQGRVDDLELRIDQLTQK